MKRAVLICWTSRGYCCFHGEYPSIAEARRTGLKLKSDGFCFSFDVSPVATERSQA